MAVYIRVTSGSMLNRRYPPKKDAAERIIASNPVLFLSLTWNSGRMWLSAIFWPLPSKRAVFSVPACNSRLSRIGGSARHVCFDYEQVRESGTVSV